MPPNPALAPRPLADFAHDAPLSATARFLIVDEPGLESSFNDAPSTLLGVGEITSAGLSSRVRRFVVYELDVRRRINLGRSPNKSDILIKDVRVSGVHAAISPGERGTSWLVDLASSNGTFLDSHCLAPGEAGRVVLLPGARIALAHIELRFVDGALLRRLATDAEKEKGNGVVGSSN